MATVAFVIKLVISNTKRQAKNVYGVINDCRLSFKN